MYKLLRIDTIKDNDRETNQYRYVTQQELEQVGIKSDEFKHKHNAYLVALFILNAIEKSSILNKLEWKIDTSNYKVIFYNNHYCTYVALGKDGR